MIKVAFMLFTIIHYINAAKILGIVTTPSYSHQVAFHPLWKELSLRGHQVTTITTDTMKNPKLINLTEINAHFAYEIWNKNIAGIVSKNPLMSYHNIINTLLEVSDRVLSYSEVKGLLNDENAKFDLVIVEYYMPNMFHFARRFNCPFIGITSMGMPNFRHRLLGNPNHPILYPDFFLPLGKRPTFIERIFSVIFSIGIEIYVHYYVNIAEQQIVNKHFGSNSPDLEELASNVSLVFTNTGPVLHQIRPLVPATIQIGGKSHRTITTTITKDLQTIMDNAPEGFIYFSLGTNVKREHVPENIEKVILETFAELPYLVLWKYDVDLENTPSNVIISKWWPQQHILIHKNIKLFITQGGLQSIEEAISGNVPMIVMPFFSDQYGNAQNVVERELGVSLNYLTLVKDEFKNNILEVINNPRYRNRIKALAELVADQPMGGLDLAIWWSEYVIRHKGAKHLRSPSLDIPLYQYLLLDVIAFFIAILTIKIYVGLALVRFLVKRVLRRSTAQKPKIN